MARKKGQLFDEHTREMADFAKALSHPARVAIVTFLQEREEACCGELVKALPLAQATVSQHLRALSEAGLISWRECGTKVCYRLERERIKSFCQAFQQALGTANQPVSASVPCNR